MIKTLSSVAVGDTVFRWFGGVSRPLELTVTAITANRIVCGEWEFDRATGAEVDEFFRWGPALTGSYVTADRIRPETN